MKKLCKKIKKYQIKYKQFQKRKKNKNNIFLKNMKN